MAASPRVELANAYAANASFTTADVVVMVVVVAHPQPTRARYPSLRKFYFFNITNLEDVLRGARPVVEEKGPYTYRAYRHK